MLESDVAYTLDLEGRRLSSTGGNNPGTYTQANTIPPGDQQMGQYTTWPGGPLTWDNQGNLASITSTAGQLDYLHDAEGRLLSVSDNATGTPVLGYAYDALGRRTIRDDQSGKVTRFIYDGNVCIQEIGADGNAAASFVCVESVQQAIITRSGAVLSTHCSSNIAPWGDPHENLNGKSPSLVTDATGTPFERFAFDDAGGPIFLEADGSPSVRTSAIGPIRWMAPESIWEPDLSLFLGSDGIYSPPLGTSVSHNHGHVTVLKSPVLGGGHVTVLKSPIHGDGHVTVIKSPVLGGGHVTVLKSPICGGGHVTVLKQAASGGSSGVARATDHNSSRSNKTSS